MARTPMTRLCAFSSLFAFPTCNFVSRMGFPRPHSRISYWTIAGGGLHQSTTHIPTTQNLTMMSSTLSGKHRQL